jgi:hypothetical protein
VEPIGEGYPAAILHKVINTLHPPHQRAKNFSKVFINSFKKYLLSKPICLPGPTQVIVRPHPPHQRTLRYVNLSYVNLISVEELKFYFIKREVNYVNLIRFSDEELFSYNKRKLGYVNLSHKQK